MSWRFRRSIRLMLGLRVNLGKRGASLSLGGRGATLNLSRRGTYATVGLSGSGLSYRTRVGGKPAAGRRSRSAGSATDETPRTVDPVTERLFLDSNLCVQVHHVSSGKHLSGDARKEFLSQNLATVAGWLSAEVDRRNDELRSRRWAPELDELPLPVSPRISGLAALCAKLGGGPPQTGSRQRAARLNALAAYRKRRLAAIDSFRTEEKANADADTDTLSERLANALNSLADNVPPPQFVVTAKTVLQPSSAVEVAVVLKDINKLPWATYVSEADEGRLVLEPLGSVAVADTVKEWALTALAACLDEIFLKELNFASASITVSIEFGSAARPVRLASASVERGVFLLEIGTGRRIVLMSGKHPCIRQAKPPTSALEELVQPKAKPA